MLLKPMQKSLCKAIIIFLLLPVLTACVRLVLRFSPSLVPNMAQAIFEECDPELAKNSIPANLKLLEGLLKYDPESEQILTTLSMGFSGYSMLFVEMDNPEAASELYLRARAYGTRALGHKGSVLKDPATTVGNLRAVLEGMSVKDLKALFWTTMSWIAWINLNLDKPAALAQISLSQACLRRIIELDGNYFHGLPYILLGISYAARPQVFGGNAQEARFYFEKALSLSDQKFFLAQYYLARYYAVRIQDKKLFLKLIENMISGDARELESACLINSVMQDRAEELMNMVDELFF
jgi:tetratricopeptide (TPR) repeat protein